VSILEPDDVKENGATEGLTRPYKEVWQQVVVILYYA